MTTAVAKPESRPTQVWDPLRSIRDEMDSLWSRLVGDRDEGVFNGRLVPSLDLSETPTAFEVRMDLPGVKPEEVDIQLSNNMLMVSGERKEEKEEKNGKFHRIERRRGSFSRSVMLPAAVAEDKIDAKYSDGVLTVTLPKSQPTQSRKIKVKT